MTIPLVDTNVILRHLLQDDPSQSLAATRFFERIQRGDARARIAETVVFEAAFTLQGFYHVPRSTIRDTLLPVLELPGVVLSRKDTWRKVFDLYTTLNLSFADAYHSVLAQQHAEGEIVSFDRGLDRVPGLRRIEPGGAD